MEYLLHLLIYFEIYVIVALSLNLIVGYCGLLTLAHAGYYAIGGYAYALLALNLGWGFLPAVLIAMTICALLSLTVSLSAWRLRGDFFVLATLAIQALIYSALYNWSDPEAALGSWKNLTNGPFGITGIPRPSFFGLAPSTSFQFAIFTTAISVLCALVLWKLQRSPWGRLLQVMRDDELAARGLGKNTRLIKLQVVAIASALVAVAGALYASYVRYLDPSSATLDEGILMLSMVIVGGLGNFKGPVIGAFTIVMLPELLRFLQFPDAQAANLHLLIYGLLLVLMMHFRPNGLAGAYRIK